MSAFQWRVVGASVPGTSHLTLGRGCEDDHAASHLPGGGLVVAVADGAGSAARAAEASQCAVDGAVTFVREWLGREAAPETSAAWERLLAAVFVGVRERLERLAGIPAQFTEIDSPLRELATTLLIAIATADWLAVAQVGDGAVVVQRTDLTFAAVTTPDHGEYVNQASFLTDDEYLAEIQYAISEVGPVAGLALFTDGLEQLALTTTTNEPFAPFFRSLFTFAHEGDADEHGVEQFLYSDRVCERTDDDKTLVLAIRTTSAGASALIDVK